MRLVNQSSKSSDIVWEANLLAGGALSAEKTPAAEQGILRGPYLQNACEDAISIRWRQSAPTPGRIDYWQPGSDKHFFMQEPLPTTEHSVRLSQLEPGQRYLYKIAGTDVTHEFRTLPPAHVAVPTRV